ncbi:MAG: type II CAAX endopeptidase family protein [bacterium]
MNRALGILVVFVVLIYAWLGYSMIVLRNPFLAMVFYYPVLCFLGGFILRKFLERHGSSDTQKNGGLDDSFTSALSLAIFTTGGLWICMLVFRYGLIPSEVVSKGLQSIGLKGGSFWRAGLMIIFLNPLFEEYFWRSGVFSILKARYSEKIALHVSSLLFAGYHPLVVSTFFPLIWLPAIFVIVYLGGLMFASLFLRSGKLIHPVILHTVINFNIIFMGWVLVANY